MKLHYSTWWLKPTAIRAITLGSHIFFKYRKSEVSEATLQHEIFHIKQVQREGFIRFYLTYLYYLIRYGYKRNPYEVEAREYVESWKNTTQSWDKEKSSWQ